MEANKMTLLNANECVAKGDHEGFLSFCTEDIIWEFVGDQILEGKHAIRQYMSEIYNEPPVFEVEYLLADDDRVVAVGRISLKDDSGQIVTSEYCDIWQFRDGKMAALKAFVYEGTQ